MFCLWHGLQGICLDLFSSKPPARRATRRASGTSLLAHTHLTLCLKTVLFLHFGAFTFQNKWELHSKSCGLRLFSQDSPRFAGKPSTAPHAPSASPATARKWRSTTSKAAIAAWNLSRGSICQHAAPRLFFRIPSHETNAEKRHSKKIRRPCNQRNYNLKAKRHMVGFL